MAAEQPSATPSSGFPYEAAGHRRGNGENQPPTDVSIDHRRHLPAPCSVATPSSLRSPFRLPAGLCVFPRTNRDTTSTPRFILEKEKKKKEKKRKRKKETREKEKISFPPGFPTEFFSLRSDSWLRIVGAGCGVVKDSIPPIGLSLPSFEVTLPFCTSLIFDTSSRTRQLALSEAGAFHHRFFLSFSISIHHFFLISAQINLFDPRCYRNGILPDRPIQFFMILGQTCSSHRSLSFSQSRFVSYRIVSLEKLFTNASAFTLFLCCCYYCSVRSKSRI